MERERKVTEEFIAESEEPDISGNATGNAETYVNDRKINGKSEVYRVCKKLECTRKREYSRRGGKALNFENEGAGTSEEKD